jgi:hypothetical protein
MDMEILLVVAVVDRAPGAPNIFGAVRLSIQSHQEFE